MKDATHFIEQYQVITETGSKYNTHTSCMPIRYLDSYLSQTKEVNFKIIAVFFIKCKTQTP
jgi:hypothetical protein